MPTESMNPAIKDILAKANVHSTYSKGGKLIVQVSQKLPLADLKNQDIVPRYLPDGTRTDVKQSPKATYLSKYRPLVGGISCISSIFGAGTLGGLVQDSTDGQIVGLTCNHCGGVLFDINYVWPYYGNTALSHIRMLQPSANDGGSDPTDYIGPPKRAVATKFGGVGVNFSDATIIDLAVDIARIDIRKMGRGPFPFVHDRTEYPPGTTVWKMGRTTGFTSGVIEAIDTNVMITNSDNDLALYQDQIMVTSDGSFATGGDSGSCILIKSQGIWKIIGLLYGGTPDDLQTFCNHIGDVADELQIESWNGNVVIDGQSPYIMVGGRCYQDAGATLKALSHTTQRAYTACDKCQADAFPSKKIHMVT